MASSKQVREDVQEYYGKTLSCSNDLKTSACTIAGRIKMAKSVRNALAGVHDDVKATFYGCGLTIPTHIEGARILDLGSGSGLDCFAISKLVGANGSVVGVDMTDEQLAIAYKFEDYHREQYGYETKNTEFVKGYIEDLTAAGLKDCDFDIIVSNCVVNLSPDKRAVLKEAYRVLKPGGELYFSDIYTKNELPDEVKNDKMLWGECLAGALPWKDLIAFSKECGFTTPRLVSATTVDVSDKQAASITGDIKFVSATYRMFKLSGDVVSVESDVTYSGSLAEYENELPFDSELTFKTGSSVTLDSELVAIIQSTRYSSIFQVSPASPVSKKSKVDNSATQCPTDPFCLLEKQGGDDTQTSKGGCCGGPATKETTCGDKQSSCGDTQSTCGSKQSSCSKPASKGCCS